MRVTFTVEDDGFSVATAADVETLTADDVIAAYRKIDPRVYDEIQVGTDPDNNNAPIMHELTDEEVIRKIAGQTLQGVLNNVVRQRAEDAAAAARDQNQAEATFTVVDENNPPPASRKSSKKPAKKAASKRR